MHFPELIQRALGQHNCHRQLPVQLSMQQRPLESSKALLCRPHQEAHDEPQHQHQVELTLYFHPLSGGLQRHNTERTARSAQLHQHLRQVFCLPLVPKFRRSHHCVQLVQHQSCPVMSYVAQERSETKFRRPHSPPE